MFCKRMVSCALALLLLMVLLAGCRPGDPGTKPAPAKQASYRLSQEEGIWWFQGPDEKNFVSLGINHIEPALICSKNNVEIFKKKFGDDLTTANGRPNVKSQAAQNWMTDSMTKMRDWGFNTVGVHNPISQNEMPYVAQFRAALVDGWRPMKKQYLDPFGPNAKRKVRSFTRKWEKRHENDPWILGISFNDMPSFYTPPGAIHPWVKHIMNLGPRAPGKKKWVATLKKRYKTPAKAAQAYGIKAKNWNAFEKQKKWKKPALAAKAHKDSMAFLPQIIDAWYGLLVASIRAEGDRRLIFGDKLEGTRDMPTWLDPILKKHVDVIYIQWYDYAENQLPRLRQLYENTGKPILLGDSSFSCPNENIPRPKGVQLDSQKSVGEAYHHYLKTVLAEPYILGWHFCGYIEGSPDIKKFHPFYAIQSGFLRPDGTPYEEALANVIKANKEAFAWHAAATPVKAVATKDDQKADNKTIGKTGEKTGGKVELLESKQARFQRIGDNVYNAGKFKLKQKSVPVKNISWVVTDEGVVVIDTGYANTARIAKKLIRSVTDKPIQYIIYTHHHGTQVGGTAVLKGPQTKVIAHEDLILEFDRAMKTLPNHARLNSIQFNFELRPVHHVPQPVYPDITFKSEYSFTLGGTKFELYHAQGEADDYTIVWLPKEKVVFVADLVGMGAPMVASPMKPVRNEVKWKNALEFVKDLKPEVMIDSVMPPISKQKSIHEFLDVRIRYLDFLHEAIIEELNAGSTAEEAVRNITLPEDLAANKLTKDGYGSLHFNVRGLHQRYRGWFDRNGTHLELIEASKKAASFVKAMGGGKAVLKKAQSLKSKGEDQLALEYLDLLIDSDDHAKEAHRLKATVLMGLAKQAKHRMMKSMYRRLSKMEKAKAGGK